MNDELKHYQHLFSTLRTDKNKKRWAESTKHQAPHKPFLLLSVLDLLASDSTNNFIEPKLSLIETFNHYWNLIMPLGSTASMSYPFYHLETSGFWHLVSAQSEKHQRGRTIKSIKRLSELYQGAKLEEDLFILSNNQKYREQLRETLITTYFDPSIHQRLWDQATINQKSEEYYKSIINHPDKPTNTVEESLSPIYQKVRDQGFRKAIVSLYEHRCAMCGIRILTTEGHTVVEAAHIIPWRETQNDSPQNGVSLCKLCHWSFDEGLMGIDSNYKVMISPSIQKDKNFSGHIQMLFDREIFKPIEDKYWPKQENLEHHRDNTYRKT